MATITFDTHAYVKKLKAAGMPEPHAEALAEAQKASLSEILDTTLATKGDVERIEREILLIRNEITLLKWMTGLMLAGVVSLVLKAFFTS
jgi:hypothetical protein